MRRRDLIKIAGAAAATASVGLLRDTPWQRLTESIGGERAADGTIVGMMEDRTADFFRTEETQPARQLFASLQSHRHALRTLIESTSNESLQKRLIATAGEAEALIGWVLFDLQRPRSAEQAWQNAVEMANEVGDGPLAACVMGYWSCLLSSRGNTQDAVRMLEQANNHVRGSAATTQAWIAGRQAEEYSALGDESNALHSLDRAMTVFDYANPRTERVWTSFFTASRLGSLSLDPLMIFVGDLGVVGWGC